MQQNAGATPNSTTVAQSGHGHAELDLVEVVMALQVWARKMAGRRRSGRRQRGQRSGERAGGGHEQHDDDRRGARPGTWNDRPTRSPRRARRARVDGEPPMKARATLPHRSR